MGQFSVFDEQIKMGLVIILERLRFSVQFHAGIVAICMVNFEAFLGTRRSSHGQLDC